MSCGVSSDNGTRDDDRPPGHHHPTGRQIWRIPTTGKIPPASSRIASSCKPSSSTDFLVYISYASGGPPTSAARASTRPRLPSALPRARRLERETPHHGRRHQLPVGTSSTPHASFASTSPPSRPPARVSPSRRDAIPRSPLARPTRRRRDNRRRVPRAHAQSATRPRLTFPPPPPLPPRAPQVDAQLPLTEGGSVDFKSSEGFKKAKATLSPSFDAPSRRTTPRSPPAPPTSSSPPPPSPPP